MKELTAMYKTRVENRVEPRTVVEQILWLRKKKETTPMHVLKLTYICHGWMLCLYDRGLITEPVEAWRYGPVIPSIYQTYKSFRGNPIDTPPFDGSEHLDDEQNMLIVAVLDAYSEFTALQLSAITHQPGTPWEKVYREGRGEGAIIPDKLIEAHYKAMAAK